MEFEYKWKQGVNKNVLFLVLNVKPMYFTIWCQQETSV